MSSHQRIPSGLPFLAGAVLLLAFGQAQAERTRGETHKAPRDGIVLFDGKDLSRWVTHNGKPAPWKVQDGYMEIVSGKGDILTKEKFGPDFQLHVEFWLPLMPRATGQGRANSGVYLQGRYEIQVL